MKIGIIGSGNVGITSAFAIAEKGSGDVLLYDIVPGRAKGKALDLIEAAPLRHYDVRISGTERFDDLLDADILVLAAGKGRKAEMHRFDLFDDNLSLVRETARRIRYERKSAVPPVTLILTEPVDLMTLAFLKESGFPREKVLGIAGIISASRLKHFIAETLRLSPADIDATVVGTHMEHMVVLERYTRIAGLPLNVFLNAEQIKAAVTKTAHAGDLIVHLAKTGSSFYTPGAAVGAVVDSIARDAKRLASVSVLMNGEYGLRDVCVSTPVKLGAGGIGKLYELKLNEAERHALHESAGYQHPLLARL